MASILLVEDDRQLNDGIKIALSKDGHSITCSYRFSEAMNLIQNKAFDLLLLDVNLPDGSGLNICKSAREKSSVPIIFLTANDTEEDMIQGYQIGCDDYIAKPFSVNVLKQKIAVLLKRIQADKYLFEYLGLTLDYDKMLVTVDGQECKLTATEYKILSYMTVNRGKVLTRNMLLEQIWDTDGNFVDENTLSVYIRRLRTKLEKDIASPQYIRTVFGIGYTFGE